MGEMGNETYKLTYFNIKGLAEPARMIFALAGVPYEDVRISHADWPQMKEKFDYGQLPVLEVGGKTLSQSNAISRYLAKKYNLNGEGDWEAAKIDELADVMSDFRVEWIKYFMEKDVEKKAELKKAILETSVPKYLGRAESIIKENGGDFLMGAKLTWVDLLYAHFLEAIVKTTGPEVMSNYPNLQKLQETVFAIPEIKAWIEKRPVTEM